MLKIYTFLFILFYSSLSAEIINKIEVKGNQRVSQETIKMFADVSLEKDFDNIDFNTTLKNLYDSNFFNTIELKIENNILQIYVEEFPIIQNVTIEGIEKTKIKDELKRNISFSSRTSFNKTLLEKDKNTVTKILKQFGFYFSNTQILIKNLGDNKVDLVYKIETGEKSKIKKIIFLGNKIYKDNKLKSIIISEEYKFWKFLSGKKYLNESIISYDINLLKNFYLNKGYYNVKVNSSFAKIIEKNEFELIYNIDPGDKIFFNEFKLNFPEDFNLSNYTKLNKYFEDLRLEPYSLNAVEKIIDEIQIITTNEQYESVNATIKENIFENKIDITFNIIETEKSYVKKINILGNNITDEKVIRNQIIVDEGDPFNEILFSKSINNIKGLNFFREVDYNIKIDEKDNSKIIDISIEEKPTGEIFAGAGTGTNGATISFGIKENNYLGKGVSVDTNANITTESIKGRFIVENPNYKNSDKSVRLSVEASEDDRLGTFGYKSTRTGFALGTNFEYYDDLFFGLATENFIEDISVTSKASNKQKKMAGNYLDSFISLDFNYDKRDQKFETSKGYYSFYNIDIPILSDTGTLNNRYNYKYFTELYDNNNSSFSFLLGTSSSIKDKDIKLSERLFIPGSKLRGFERGKIGPKDGNDFIGGNYMSAINLSSSLPQIFENYQNLDIAIFLDLASVWGVDYDDAIPENNEIRSAIGIGLNWTTVIGPLSFSLAQPITKADTDITESFRFNLGTTF
jgi:outer membrane protein insertion porin family